MNVLQYVKIDSEAIDDVVFVKIDLEQHERELRGAIETIRRWRPVIMAEVNPLKYDRGLQDVFEFITDCSYVGWFRFDKDWLPLSSFDSITHASMANFGSSSFAGNNLLFFPLEHALSMTGPG